MILFCSKCLRDFKSQSNNTLCPICRETPLGPDLRITHELSENDCKYCGGTNWVEKPSGGYRYCGHSMFDKPREDCESCGNSGIKYKSYVHPTNYMLDDWLPEPCGCQWSKERVNGL
jgi:hypothetical protein